MSAAGPSHGRPRERGEAKGRRARPRAWMAADREALRVAVWSNEAAHYSASGGGAVAALVTPAARVGAVIRHRDKPREAGARYGARGGGTRACLLGPVQTQRGANHAGFAAQIGTERDVVEHAHLRNELDVLKCAADTAARDFVGFEIADRLAAKY